MSSLLNNNQCIYLTFDTNSHATATINITQPIKEIIFRNAQFQTADTNSSLQYGVITSNLVNGGTCGIVTTYFGTNGPIPSSVGTIRYCYKTPINVGGTYDFYLKSFTNTLWGTNNSSYNAVLLIEFVTWKSEITDTSA